MSNNTLVVCGDSYMSPVVRYPGKHFSEILANKLGYNLIPLSRNGMSNGGIVLQLESAAELRPDLILIGTTFSSRIEYPIKNSLDDQILNSKNVLYQGSYSLSSFIENEYLGSNPILVSTNVTEILDDDKLPNFPFCDRQVENFDEKVKTIRKWFEFVYHDGWKTKQDQLMLYSALHKIDSLGLKYILCFDYIGLGPTCPWIKDNISKEFMDRASNETALDKEKMPFHTSLDLQNEFAEIIFNRLKNNL